MVHYDNLSIFCVRTTTSVYDYVDVLPVRNFFSTLMFFRWFFKEKTSNRAIATPCLLNAFHSNFKLFCLNVQFFFLIFFLFSFSRSLSLPLFRRTFMNKWHIPFWHHDKLCGCWILCIKKTKTTKPNPFYGPDACKTT